MPYAAPACWLSERERSASRTLTRCVRVEIVHSNRSSLYPNLARSQYQAWVSLHLPRSLILPRWRSRIIRPRCVRGKRANMLRSRNSKGTRLPQTLTSQTRLAIGRFVASRFLLSASKTCLRGPTPLRWHVRCTARSDYHAVYV